MRSQHIIMAHKIWEDLLEKGDCAIDATCGNGHDTLFLAKTIVEGRLIAMDIQDEAVQKTLLLVKEYPVEVLKRSHETFPEMDGVKLIVYNLGYLPGGDKSLTTKTSVTLTSVKNALELIVPGGMVSITCYPGHPEGAVEQKALLEFTEKLSSSFEVQHFDPGSPKPSLLTIRRH